MLVLGLRTLVARSLDAKSLEEGGSGLGAKLEALDAALQAVPRGNCRLPATRCVGELVLGAGSIGEQTFQSSLRAPLGEQRGIPASFRLSSPRTRVGEIDLGDARAQRGDLDPELLGALGRRGLKGKRPQALAHLLLDVPSALDLHGDARELQLGAVAAALELSKPGSFLDERAPVLRLGRQHLLDLALADDRVHRRSEADVGEDLDEIGAPNRSAVDEVLALGPAHEPPRDGDLGEIEIRPRAVLVVEDELDLAVLGGLAIAATGEQHVVRLLRAELGRRQRPGRPDDRVGDVGLAGAVRADDDGDPRLERDLEGLRERLEAADAKRAQVHRSGILATAPDVRRLSPSIVAQ